MKELEKVLKIKRRRFLLKVEQSKSAGDYTKYEELRDEIWGEPTDTLPGERNMVCENFYNDGSALFIAVYIEDDEGTFLEDKDHFIGFSYGFVGVEDKAIGFRSQDNLIFYSQYTGIKEDWQSYGLGIRMKEFQKEIMLSVFGVFKITCTYDPLTGINAYRNIHHFGMDVVDYKEACYGEFGGHLNRTDVPCDRFYLSWDLRKKIQRPDYDLDSLFDSGHTVLRSRLARVRGRSGKIELEVIEDKNLDLDKEFLLVEIPYDFYLMARETDVEDQEVRNIPLNWRMTSREVFHTLFKKKYEILDFRCLKRQDRRRDFYVLKKKSD